MPMYFLDYQSLIEAARVHGFRRPDPDEPEEEYRWKLADYVTSIDYVESMEIRYKWWPPEEGPPSEDHWSMKGK